ncbi:hypothetical protein TNCV_2223601 [Trichonephila clavipes]|nr:hypothetical protein TNCV_2223601 [Trichonephila clavipes]
MRFSIPVSDWKLSVECRSEEGEESGKIRNKQNNIRQTVSRNASDTLSDRLTDLMGVGCSSIREAGAFSGRIEEPGRLSSF